MLRASISKIIPITLFYFQDISCHKNICLFANMSREILMERFLCELRIDRDKKMFLNVERTVLMKSKNLDTLVFKIC